MAFDHYCDLLATPIGVRNHLRFWVYALVQTFVALWGMVPTSCRLCIHLVITIVIQGSCCFRQDPFDSLVCVCVCACVCVCVCAHVYPYTHWVCSMTHMDDVALLLPIMASVFVTVQHHSAMILLVVLSSHCQSCTLCLDSQVLAWHAVGGCLAPSVIRDGDSICWNQQPIRCALYSPESRLWLAVMAVAASPSDSRPASTMTITMVTTYLSLFGRRSPCWLLIIQKGCLCFQQFRRAPQFALAAKIWLCCGVWLNPFNSCLQSIQM